MDRPIQQSGFNSGDHTHRLVFLSHLRPGRLPAPKWSSDTFLRRTFSLGH